MRWPTCNCILLPQLDFSNEYNHLDMSRHNLIKIQFESPTKSEIAALTFSVSMCAGLATNIYVSILK